MYNTVLMVAVVRKSSDMDYLGAAKQAGISLLLAALALCLS